MSQMYSDPKRQADPHALPDVEVFHHEHAKRELCALNAGHKAEMYGECITDEEGNCMGTGWYYWYCLPGCLPDGPANGPYPTQADAESACREERAQMFPEDEEDE